MPERHTLTTDPERRRLDGSSPLNDAILIRAGVALGHNLDFPPAILQAAVPLFDGRPCFVDHGGWFDDNRSVRDLAGQVHAPRWDELDQSIHAQVEIFQPDIQSLIDQAKGSGYFGLSAVVYLTRNGDTVASIESIESVDIVIRPAAGGRFLSAHNPPQETATMSEPTPIVETVALSEPSTVPAEPAIAPPAEDPARRRLDGSSPPPNMDLAALEMRLARLTVQTSGLPAQSQAYILQALNTGDVTPQGLGFAIDTLRQTLAQAAAQPAIMGLGQPRLSDSLDRVTLAFERLMGLPLPAEHSSVPRLSGIREMYDLLTGDHERFGVYRPDRVSLANATTTTMASVVANVLNKVLIRSYEMRPQWWTPIALQEDFPNMQQVRWVYIGGVADLDTVAEGGSYTEKAWDDAYETADWVKKGNYIGLTLEMIDRDDVGAVRQIPRRLGLAAARTLSSSIAALFTSSSGTGPQLVDTYHVFDSSNHSNLLTTALSADAWDAVIQAMFKQTELNSAKRLGIRPRYCLVPIELEKTALTIFGSDREPGTTDNDANVRRMSDAVITVPEWTDTNNWAAVASPMDLSGVCIAYRFGRQPELFVADGELMSAMFTNDEMRVKVRFVYAVGIGDYRALHKNNVT